MGQAFEERTAQLPRGMEEKVDMEWRYAGFSL